MGTPFLGEIRMFSFNFPPKGWGLCNGQLLPINQNQALFALLGTMYGGNGQTNFALPNLRGRTPISAGGGHTQGEAAGSEAVTITMSQMPAHNHGVLAGNVAANASSPANNFSAQNAGAYSLNPNAAMSPATVTPVGGSQAHQNMGPYLVISFCIALQGIFPSQN
ncbi:MAG TPA: tail fiber protein [Pyrinomonadaceae bacterium]|jgi:microcystin-dependent protein|nr:tail fiber protein [Pyrinomonadaceae bacterium]